MVSLMTQRNSTTHPDKVIIGVQIGSMSGCAVYKNGEILFAASEERYSGRKNDTAFPDSAIRDSLAFCRLSRDNIEKVVLVSNAMSPEHFLVNRECKFSIEDYFWEQKHFYKPRIFEGKDVEYLEIFKEKVDQRYADLYEMIRKRKGDSKSKIWNEWRITKVSKLLGIEESRVVIVNHEKAHAAYGYYGSPLRGEDVLVVTFDSYGDEANALIGVVSEGQLRPVHRYTDYNIGRIYRYITLLLGMKPFEHEFKVMGLAPYATEYTYRKALGIFRQAYRFCGDGTIEIDPSLTDHFYYFKEKLEACRFDAIAGALQIFTEQMNCSLVKFWLDKLDKKRLVLSGGVSLNIKDNMEIGKLDGVEDIFVVGSGGDDSLCIAGIHSYLDELGRGSEIKPLASLYLGGDVKSQEVDEAVSRLRNEVDIEVVDATAKNVAAALAQGNIVGRVAGRMEFGARALGNRSILADPRSPEVIKKINYQIKNRDFWMPFTPSMLPTAAARYLGNPKRYKYPYMSVACETTCDGRRALAGALHPADQTARPQIVDPAINPYYFELLTEFEKLTGVGALLNTSLNLHGYPIARTADDAAHVFKNSGLDGLVLGDKLIVRLKSSEET